MTINQIYRELIDGWELNNLGLGKKLGLKKTSEVLDWYEYFINEFLPSQGELSMTAFIDCNFDPLCTLLKICLDKGILDGHKFKMEIKDFLNKLSEGVIENRK